ncbi:unnamed protein product, partial [Dracunculus medinensis]|uniref:EB domain-containing protein n=1 Tax=Dracunculus medinensis TaxID=318479 RepID=A0A0N4UR39_DRAME
MHNQCRVFESCFRNECKLDFIDCPGGVCAPHHVCVAGRCLRDPLAPAACPDGWRQNDRFNACYIAVCFAES